PVPPGRAPSPPPRRRGRRSCRAAWRAPGRRGAAAARHLVDELSAAITAIGAAGLEQVVEAGSPNGRQSDLVELTGRLTKLVGSISATSATCHAEISAAGLRITAMRGLPAATQSYPARRWSAVGSN
ncbi:hypothetical protein, partial [Nonomuraea recticatena]|uniref:hypothetical protein n=1 Tax=Nonomuraea recticatena TaxID=46178 RepID=UPI0031F81244